MEVIFAIAILILSIIVHEIAHGLAANALGDPTAKYAGRLTLNPVPHIDPVGSIILPLVTYFSGGFIFGWAKPVPYNPYNLRNQTWGESLVALAGPASNVAIAVLFGLLVRLAPLSQSFTTIFSLVVLVNLSLAIFNLIPIPPLDGSKILFAFLPISALRVRYFLEQWGFFVVILFVIFLWRVISPLIGSAFTALTGLAF
ncbi:MAG TPA: site-2 protease family protein [Candidatus Paceibacterota bacterium]|nr:site-2 protease family protein [Candidatus Paceibacterota bacterium]